MSDTPAPDITPTPSNLVTVYGVGALDASQTIVNEYAVLSIPAVWRAVNWKVGTMATIAKEVCRQVGRNAYVTVPHPITKLLNRKINPFTNPATVWETLLYHAEIWGNGYALITRQPGTFTANALYNVDPEKVTPFRILEGPATGQWYYVKDGKGPGEPMILPAADVLHFKGLGYDGMQGYPLVTILAESFQWARNVGKFAARYFQKGTQVQGSIEIPLNVKDDQIAKIKDQIRRQHSGMEADYSHLILSGGATLKNSTIPPQQSQLIETTSAVVLDIARIMSVPPWKLYELGEAKWANVEQQELDSVKDSLRRPVEKIEEELNAKLLTEKEQDSGLTIRFCIEELTRGDSTTLTNTTISKVNAGLITVNEGRAILGDPPSEDPNADKLRVPVNSPVPGEQLAPPPAPKPVEKQQNAAVEHPAKVDLNALKPILDHAFAIVETKTDKAFGNKAGKSGQELTIWANVFANDQAAYVRATLSPIAAVCAGIDVDAVADRYAQAIRKRAGGGEWKGLNVIFSEVGGAHGGNEVFSK